MELTGFLTVDENKLNTLEDKVVADLHRQGALAMAYLHLLSLRQFKALMAMAAAHEPEAEPKPQSASAKKSAKASVPA